MTGHPEIKKEATAVKNRNKVTEIDREELSRTFAVCTCILILICMGLVLLLGGCSAKEEAPAAVTAKFYADPSRTIVCRNTAYNCVLRDGMWILDSTDTEEVLPYESFRDMIP